jgi:stage V sporulation protein SpoVS
MPSGPGNMSGNRVRTVARHGFAGSVMAPLLRHQRGEIEPLHQGAAAFARDADAVNAGVRRPSGVDVVIYYLRP